MKRIIALTAALTLTFAGAHNHEKHGAEKYEGVHHVLGQINTRDAHALLWLADGRLLFGHHDGVQVSTDKGATFKDLVRKTNFDAMNLALSGNTVILAGHDIYAKSTDGKTWADIKPRGMNGLDLHGYAVDPKNPKRHYALEARTGVHVSDDGGANWKLAKDAPRDVYALAAGTGSVYALTGSKGLLESTDGLKTFKPVATPKNIMTVTVASDGALWIAGKEGIWRHSGKAWTQIAATPAFVLAVNPKNPLETVWIDDKGAVHHASRDHQH